jgi:site-specific DNA-adenine methylase
MQKEAASTLLPNALDYDYWRNVRDHDLPNLTTQEQATRFASCLFTAWGNRWKTEDDGHFTASSTPVNPKFCDPVKLTRQLEGFFKVRWLTPVDSIQTTNWSQALEPVLPGDLVYLDPPYPEHLGYGAQIWTLSQMLDTIDWMAEANRRGVFILASNVADLERLYQRAGLRTQIITLSEASLTRKARREVLATNLPIPESLLDRMLSLGAELV